VNRKVFWFNDKVDIYVAEPISTGWDFIAPARVKNSVANFFTNLRFPINAVNNLLQAKPRAFLVDVGRFLANTTVGVAGLFDPATDWGLELRREDFGQTLGVWGLGGGPYLVIPILGPSNLRDTIGLSVDSLTAVYPWLIPWAYSFGGVAVNTINTRAMLLSVVRDAKGAAIDYYSFVRNAYGQRRKAMISDRPEMTNAEQEDLYQVDTDGEP
jgi:phospholipid-binding lipoprotein MlaA